VPRSRRSRERGELMDVAQASTPANNPAPTSPPTHTQHMEHVPPVHTNKEGRPALQTRGVRASRRSLTIPPGVPPKTTTSESNLSPRNGRALEDTPSARPPTITAARHVGPETHMSNDMTCKKTIAPSVGFSFFFALAACTWESGASTAPGTLAELPAHRRVQRRQGIVGPRNPQRLPLWVGQPAPIVVFAIVVSRGGGNWGAK